MADDNSIVTEINPVRRQVLRGAIAAATVAGASTLSLRPLYAAAAKPEVTKAVLGLHRADRCIASDHREGEGLLRQARHAGRRGHEAGFVGHDARQPRARLCRQRHRRRAHPDADAVSDQQRQGHAEQRADADVRARAAQSRQPGDLRRGRVRRPEARARCEAVQGGAREEEGGGQCGQGRDDVPGRNARLLDPLLARGRRHRSRQGHRDDRRAPAANGRQHEGRHDGLLLRRRAVERAAEEPEDRLHGGQHGARSGTSIPRRASRCARTGSTRTRTRRRRC